MTDPLRSPKLKTWHLDRGAIVYVRQSTPQQVLDHRESTVRQYALADRAATLGWPRDGIAVIDDDLGKSGSTVEGRLGFQRLLAEVALDRVGIILGLEMSRLARSCKDWHHLLELCARFRVLLADADGLYDPTEHSDRLLLGLTGMMNEAELHVLKQRMHQGKLNKARRGELFGHAPIGYVRSPSGAWVIDPDEQVQAVIRLIFDQFDREATLHGLLRYLVHHGIRMPVRAHGGLNRGTLEWRRPNRATLQGLLRHPVYAGAYRYGHRPTEPRRKQPGRPTTGRLLRRPEECEVFLRDRLPAYIPWDRFEANQARLTANRTVPSAPVTPRFGSSLLAGLIRCGRCGRRMMVRYSGPKNRLNYTCTRGSADYAEPLCQGVSNGVALDAVIAEAILAAVEPAALEASLAAVATVERERGELARQWQLRRERARFEADRAARQFHACEPENRLVARELERRWNEALKHQQQLDDDCERWQRTTPSRLTDEDTQAIRALAGDLPTLWHADTTTPADRQRIARLLLDRITVTVDKTSERLDVILHWVGGSTQSHAIRRTVNRYDQQHDYPKLVERLRCCGTKLLTAAEIAAQLNAEGFRPPKRVERFTPAIVLRLLSHLRLTRRQPLGRTDDLGPDEYRPSTLARTLDISRDTVQRWRKSGWLTVHRDAQGHSVIWADADELHRLRNLHRLPRTWENRARWAELIRPKPRPAS